MSWMIRDLVQEYSKPKFWLAKRNKEIVSRLSELDCRSNFTYNFTEVSELTGTIPLEVERDHKTVQNKNFEIFRNKMLIKMQLMDMVMWFTIEGVTKIDDDAQYLSFVAYSYEYSLNASKLYEAEFEEAKAEDNINKALEETIWRCNFIDTKLTEKYRKFEFSTGTTVLDALYEMAGSYGGILKFDADEHYVGLYHEDTLCVFDDFVINPKNYIDNLEDERDGQQITTRLTAIGYEAMTFNTVSPSGQSYAENFSGFMYPYEEDENGNTIKSSYYMSDGLCHNLLRLKKARDLIAPTLKEKFQLIKQYQSELIPLEEAVSDEQLAHDLTNNALDVMRKNNEYYYNHKNNKSFTEEVRSGYYVLQVKAKKTATGSLKIVHDYGTVIVNVTNNTWETRKLDIFEDQNFDPDKGKETLNITISGDVEYMMVRVFKQDQTSTTAYNAVATSIPQQVVQSTVQTLSTDNIVENAISQVAKTSFNISTFATPSSLVTRDYFITGMTSYINRVKNEINNNSDLIVISNITDTHYTENSLRSAAHKVAHERGLEYTKLSIEMSKHINLDAISHTGDMIDGRALPEQSDQELNAIVDAYNVVNVPKILVKGNHDTNYLHYGRTGTNITANSLEAKYFLPNTRTKTIMSKFWSADNIKTDSYNTDGVYGYVDLNSKKTRIIMLDSYDLNEVLDTDGKRIYSPRTYTGYRQRQLTWLVNTLQSTPLDYDVLVYSHVSLTKGYDADATEFNRDAVTQILKAFQRRTDVTYNFQHNHFGVSINADFKNSNRTSVILATIAGHEHADKSEKDTLIDSAVPNIVRQCSTPAFSGTSVRAVGSVDETAFDTILIDKSKKTIKFLRFGLGTDLEITYGKRIDSGGNIILDEDEVPLKDPTSSTGGYNPDTILDREEDKYLTNDKLLVKYNIMYHVDQLAYKQSLVEQMKAKIEFINEELKEIKEQIAEEKFLTPEQIKEKVLFTFTDYFIDDTHIDEQEMYDDTLKKLEELNTPSINMTIDIHNFLNSIEHKRNWEKLDIGKKIRVKHRDLDIYSEAILSRISFDFENEDISLTITGTKDINDPEKQLAKMLYDFSSTSSTLALKKFIYDDASNKANAASDYMKSNLEAARQRIHAGVNESVSLSNRGLVITNIDYPNELLIATAGVFAISDDGGQTFRMAITAQGITAEEIVGKIIISNKAWIQDDNGIVTIKGDLVEIKDPYGNRKVAMGQYSPNKWGMEIDGGALEIKNGGLRPEHLENALNEVMYTIDVVALDGTDFAFDDSTLTITCRVYDSKNKDITSEFSKYAFNWQKIYVQTGVRDYTWENQMYGKGATIEANVNCADCIIKCVVQGIRNN